MRWDRLSVFDLVRGGRVHGLHERGDQHRFPLFRLRLFPQHVVLERELDACRLAGMLLRPGERALAFLRDRGADNRARRPQGLDDVGDGLWTPAAAVLARFGRRVFSRRVWRCGAVGLKSAGRSARCISAGARLRRCTAFKLVRA